MEETQKVEFVSPVSINIVPEKAGIFTFKKSEKHNFLTDDKQYLMIFVKSGAGAVSSKTENCTFSKDTLFFLKPLQSAEFSFSEASKTVLLSFYSDSSSAFNLLPFICDYKFNSFIELEQNIISNNCSAEYTCFVILDTTANITNKHTLGKKSFDYVSEIKNTIEKSYMTQITVQDIADKLSLNRQYLTRLFKAHTGMSIQEYLIHVRLEKAAKFLKSGTSVNNTANLVGYSDQFAFSRIFKKKYGKSPSQYHEK